MGDERESKKTEIENTISVSATRSSGPHVSMRSLATVSL